MFNGSYVLSQVFDLLNRFEFDKCVSKHQGNYRVKTFSCWEQFIVMTFAQLSFRESLRDIEFCLAGMKTKMYHCGIKSTVARSTLAKANENRSWKIYEDFGQSLIKIALPMHKATTNYLRNLNQSFMPLIVRLLTYVWNYFHGQNSGKQKVPLKYMYF
jgi:hypothetical protein